jgi:hypothetical protein
MAVLQIELSKIRIDGETQNRPTDDDYIKELMENLDVLKAGYAYFDGQWYWLADGFHRFFAHEKSGRKTMKLEYTRGTKLDAQFYSLGANATHGRPRTSDDKATVVRRCFNHPEWCQWSLRQIAEACKVSHAFVTKIKKEMEAEAEEASTARASSAPADEPPPPPTPIEVRAASKTVVAKDGRKMPAKAPAKKPEPEVSSEVLADAVFAAILPPKVKAAFDSKREHLDPLLNVLKQAMELATTLTGNGKDVKTAASGELLAFFHKGQELAAGIRNLRNLVTAHAPHAACPYCKGDGCNACKSLGWVPQQVYDAAPADLKAA